MTIELTRRNFLAASAAGLAAATAFPIHVNAQGQKVLTVTIPSNPSTFDPINQANHDAMVISQLIFENLLEVDGDGNLVPMLAKDLPQVSADGLVYTFELRDDVTFHNGRKLTAADVKYSYDFMLNPDNKALRRSYWTAISTVEAVSDTVVKFTLSKPNRPLLYSMTKYMGIFPAGSREEFGAEYFQNTPIGLGTGPGVFVSAVANDHVELRRNENYWRKETPQWDIARIRIVPEATGRLAALLSGDVDIIQPDFKDFNRLAGGSTPGVGGASKPAFSAGMLMMHNTGAAPFDDVEFRRAVAMGIDRASIGEKVFGGLLDPTSVLVPRASRYYNSQAAEKLSYNPEKAKEHLAKSAHVGNAAFELTFPTDAYLMDVKNAVLLAQANLAEIGINVTLNPMETGQMFGQLFKGNLQTVFWAVVGTLDPTFLIQAMYVQGQALAKVNQFNSDELNALVDQRLATDDEDELKTIIARIQDIIADQAPGASIGTPHAFNLFGSRVSDFAVNAGITLRLRDVKVG